MAIQTLLQGDVSDLRQESSPISSFDADLESLVEDLVDTLQEHRGLALSAPQIGIQKCVFVIDTGGGPEVYVNPELVAQTGSVEGFESCLSFPDYVLKMTRPEQIVVQARDVVGEPIEITATALKARVLSQQLDHLKGKLFIDYLSDEELFYQLLGSTAMVDPTPPVNEETMPIAPNSKTELAASRDELQFSVDMLSELGWKMALAVEILKDYGFGDTLNWAGLGEVVSVIDDAVNVVEQRIESLDAMLGERRED